MEFLYADWLKLYTASIFTEFSKDQLSPKSSGSRRFDENNYFLLFAKLSEKHNFNLPFETSIQGGHDTLSVSVNRKILRVTRATETHFSRLKFYALRGAART